MIHVEYEKEKNYPHNRELILFDRNAFQALGDKWLHKVNEKYTILCPEVFLVECLAPNNLSEKHRIVLRRRLGLIENPIVLKGNANISLKVIIPSNTKFIDYLRSWQIARNCIANYPVTMERVSPEKLVLDYELRVQTFKFEMRVTTQVGDDARDELLQDQELQNAAEEALKVIGEASKEEIISGFRVEFNLSNTDVEKLINHLQNDRKLTIENYPHLSYPIYIHYLKRFMLFARQQDARHLDQSYVPDFEYLHYLNFCDKFIANETSTPDIVRAIPYSGIRDICIMTSEELRKSLT
jgi:uncharacterized protein with HEPN domain